MRKFLFNAGFVSALFSGFNLIRITVKGPRDWRLLLTWISWAVALLLAIGGIVSPEQAEEPAEKNSKKAKKK